MLFLSLVSNGCVTTSDPEVAAKEPPKPGSPALAVVPKGATQAFYLLGKGPVYLVHKSTGVVLEVGLLDTTLDTLELYRQDQARTGERLYTLTSEAFALSEVTPNANGKAQRATFLTTLYRGDASPGAHGAAVLARDVQVQVKRVIFAPNGESAAGNYEVFGNEQELFATPTSGATQILRVRVARGVLNDKEAARLRAGSSMRIATPPSVGQSCTAQIGSGKQTRTVQVDVLDALL